MALALEEPASLIIVDDLLARKIAQLRGLRLTGTAGVLLRAKREGYISDVRPLLDRLIELGFHLSDEVKNRIIQQAGE